MFRDREEAGRKLAQSLEMKTMLNPVVIAVSRGGAIVAGVLAREYGATLELAFSADFETGERLAGMAAGRTVIVTDDGKATMARLLVALNAVQSGGPAEILVVLPASCTAHVIELEEYCDEVICLQQLEPLRGAEKSYERFPEVQQTEVVSLLEELTGKRHPSKRTQ